MTDQLLQEQLSDWIEQLEAIVEPLHAFCLNKEDAFKRADWPTVLMGLLLMILVKRQAFDDWTEDFVRWADSVMGKAVTELARNKSK